MTIYTLTGGQTVDASGDSFGETDEFHISGSGNLAIGHSGVDYVSDDGLDNTIEGGGNFDAGYANLSASSATFSGNIDGIATSTGVHLADGSFISGMDEMGVLFGSGNDTVSAVNAYVDLYGGSGDDQLSGQHNGTELSGQAGSDTLTGGPGNDDLYGFMSTNTGFSYGVDDGSGDDVLYGGGGDDSLTGSLGNDTIYGGSGDDTVGFRNVIDGSAGVSVKLTQHGEHGERGRVHGAAGTDVLNSVENASGSQFNDTITGSSGDNTLSGGHGSDTITGGGGGDRLDGGPFDDVSDMFKYLAASDSTPVAPDTIVNFEHAIDKINLRPIDADGDPSNGDTAFTLVHAFDGHAGELVISFSGGSGSFSVDTDGDGEANMTVYVDGDGLTRGDFQV
jgi:Ca2+-binding RTX toxin-like protein